MDYEVKKMPKSEVELTVTVSKTEMEEFEKKACDIISKDVNVKGFRPGHVPPHILEQHVEKKYIIAQAQELAIQQTYADAVIKEKLQVMSRPKVKIEEDEPLKYTAIVAVLPEVELKDYKSIKVEKKEPKVEKKEVDDVIEDLKKRGTEYEKVDRKAKKDDRVEVDFEGFDKKGKAVANTKSENHPIIIGSDVMIPGFEDELIGLKAGEKKEFDITFPKDYQKKDMQGEKFKFKVEMKIVSEAKAPKFDEVLIEKLTGKKQKPEEFRKEIEKNLSARKKEETKQDRENKYVEELLKLTKVEIPETMIEEEVEFLVHDVKHNVESKGLEWKTFLEKNKMDEEGLRKKYHELAEKNVKVRLALQQIIKEEKIEVNEGDLSAELTKIKSFYPAEQHAKIDEDYKKGELKNQIANRLTLRKLFEKVLE